MLLLSPPTGKYRVVGDKISHKLKYEPISYRGALCDQCSVLLQMSNMHYGSQKEAQHHYNICAVTVCDYRIV